MNKSLLKLIMQVKMLIVLLDEGASGYDQEVQSSIKEIERLIGDLHAE